MKMKRTLSIILVVAFVMSSCSQRGATTTQVGTATGGVVGAGVGAIIGSQTGDAVGGTAIGALAGAGAGAAIGDAIEDKERIIAVQDRAIMKHDQQIAQHQKELAELRALSGDQVQFSGTTPTGQMEYGKYSDGMGTSYDGSSDVRARMGASMGTATGEKVYVDPKTIRLPGEAAPATTTVTTPPVPTYNNDTYNSDTYNSGGLRERSIIERPTYQQPTYQQPTYQQPTYQQPQTPPTTAGDTMVVAKIPEMSLEDLVVDTPEQQEPIVVEEEVSVTEVAVANDAPNAFENPVAVEKPAKIVEVEETETEIIENIEEQPKEDLNQVFNEINSAPAVGAIAVEKTEDSDALSVVQNSGDTSEECQKAAKEAEKGSEAVATADKLFYFRRALRLCPGESNWHVELGKVYASLGRSEDAKFEYEEALRITPGLPGAMAGLQSVENGTY